MCLISTWYLTEMHIRHEKFHFYCCPLCATRHTLDILRRLFLPCLRNVFMGTSNGTKASRSTEQKKDTDTASGRGGGISQPIIIRGHAILSEKIGTLYLLAILESIRIE